MSGRTCSEWIDRSIAEIERDFLKPKHGALMEFIGPHGEMLDHFGGRTLDPGHAMECAWFIMHGGALRKDAHGEWDGWLHGDGSVSSRAKGSMWKRPFHLPRCLWYCSRLLADEWTTSCHT